MSDERMTGPEFVAHVNAQAKKELARAGLDKGRFGTAPNWPRDWFAANAPMPVPNWFRDDPRQEIHELQSRDPYTYDGGCNAWDSAIGQLFLRREVAWRWHYADEMMRQRGTGE